MSSDIASLEGDWSSCVFCTGWGNADWSDPPLLSACGRGKTEAGNAPMFYRITFSGLLEPVATLNGHDEVMLHCARIGYNP